jgi:hypothetical protein
MVSGLPGQDPGGGSGSCRSTYAPLVTVVGKEVDYQAVGEAHVMYDSTGKFEYGEHANTDLNGAYSAGGGPYSTSGSANHMGNKSGMVRQAFTAHQAYVVRTGFHYRKERLDFTDDQGDGHVCRSDFRIIPDGWVAGAILGDNVSSHDSAGQMDAARGKTWATLFGPDTEFEKNTSKGQKYKTGVTAFGITLGAQSEWSNQVDVHWTFGSGDDHWLYGSDNTVIKAKNVYAW